jgi:hypothetical protein
MKNKFRLSESSNHVKALFIPLSPEYTHKHSLVPEVSLMTLGLFFSK